MEFARDAILKESTKLAKIDYNQNNIVMGELVNIKSVVFMFNVY